ncbi:MAG: response regulator transcription factor [Fimbriimonas sp.]
MNILLVEDERPIAAMVSRVLKRSGWRVEWTPDGAQGFEEAKKGTYDLVILDVLVPRKNGWDILAGLRAAKVNVPILMLTAMDEVGDRVKGLNLGADDYLSKPFDPAELTARVNALLRRDKANKGHSIQIADLTIDRISRQVTRADQPINLTRREYELLETLALSEGQTLSKDTLFHRVWGDEEAYSNTVEVFIGTLRKKVDAPFERKLIHTEVGFGYVMRAT